MLVDTPSRLGRLLANIAGWFGRSRSYSTTTSSAAISSQLIMPGLAAKSRRRGGSPAATNSAPPMPPIVESSIVIVPLPSGIGWSPYADDDYDDDSSTDLELILGATALDADDEDSDYDFGALFGDDTEVVSILADDDDDQFVFLDAQIGNENLIASIIDIGTIGIVANDAIAPASIHRPPLLLARQLRGVARLNSPTSRRNAKPQGYGRPRPSLKVATSKPNRPTSSARTASGHKSAGRTKPEASRAVRLPKAQPWILSRAR